MVGRETTKQKSESTKKFFNIIRKSNRKFNMSRFILALLILCVCMLQITVAKPVPEINNKNGEDLSMLSLYYDDDLVNDQFQLNLIDRSKRHVRDKTHRTKHRGTKRRSRNHMKRRKGHSQHTIDHLTRKLRRKHTSSRHD